jgi:hypothetical protein
MEYSHVDNRFHLPIGLLVCVELLILMGGERERCKLCA